MVLVSVLTKSAISVQDVEIICQSTLLQGYGGHSRNMRPTPHGVQLNASLVGSSNVFPNSVFVSNLKPISSRKRVKQDGQCNSTSWNLRVVCCARGLLRRYGLCRYSHDGQRSGDTCRIYRCWKCSLKASTSLRGTFLMIAWAQDSK